MRTPRILLFGELLWDIPPSGKLPGGAPANVAVQTHHLGAATHLISAVGDDELGIEILKELQTRTVPTRGIQVKSMAPTSTVEITLSDNGIPTYLICPNVAWDDIDATKETLAAACECDAFYFGTLSQRAAKSRASLNKLLEALPATCVRFCDINIRHPHPHEDVVESSLNHADILKLSDEELPLIAKMFDLPNGISAFMNAFFKKFPARIIAYTQGAKGAEIFARNGTSSVIPAEPVEKIADTIGAGDAFSAGLLVGTLQGLSPFEAGKLGCHHAARICGLHGAWG